MNLTHFLRFYSFFALLPPVLADEFITPDELNGVNNDVDVTRGAKGDHRQVVEQQVTMGEGAVRHEEHVAPIKEVELKELYQLAISCLPVARRVQRHSVGSRLCTSAGRRA